MLITSPRKLSVLENFLHGICAKPPCLATRTRSARIARQDCHQQPRSANIAQEPQLKLVKIPNASQNAVFNPILRLFLPQNPGGPGINFKYTENFLQNCLKFQVYWKFCYICTNSSSSKAFPHQWTRVIPFPGTRNAKKCYFALPLLSFSLPLQDNIFNKKIC